MGLERMGSTQRGGSKRVAVLEELVAKAVAGGDPATLIRVALDAATGLTTPESKRNFRRECEVVTDPRVLAVFGPALRLANRIKVRSMQDPKDQVPAPLCAHRNKPHSAYHVLVPICRHIRKQPGPPMQALRDVARDYALFDVLPSMQRRRRPTRKARHPAGTQQPRGL